MQTPSSATYKSIVAYDGTHFSGSQRQAKDRRTVQSELERALKSIGWQGNSILLAGRTDKGVHASGQVISFQLDWKHDTRDLTAALNANLPPDVAVRNSERVGEAFHPRFSARSRRYRYAILIDQVRDPLQERYAWRIETEPDLDLLRSTASLIHGEHDFGGFGSAPVKSGHTRRSVLDASWVKLEKRLWFEIEADAFLYHMVRKLVSTGIEIGHGKSSIEEFSETIENPGRQWQGLAPAHGLCLTDVRYD
jgi:tRNA pseudouridine38-40 synthase